MVRWLIAAMLVALAAAACGENRATPDGAPGTPECSDQLDNDGDGRIDFPADPGCTDPDDPTEGTVTPPACSDHVDNDGDGRIDFPADPGCAVPQSDSEDDDCPGGPGCPQCANGKDDDGNGSTDYPADPGCESAGDAVEFSENPAACGATLKIKPLPGAGIELGTLDATSVANVRSPCNAITGTPGVAYLVVLTEPTVLVISTFGSAADTVLDLRAAACTPATAEIACNDNVGGTDKSSRLTRSLMPGAYYLIVSGKTAVTTGAYTLKVDRFAGEGTRCTDTAQCGPGLVCRVPAGGTDKACTKPVCSDGADNDGDGLADYPLDPGCASPDGGDEVDDCPSGPGCPECSDGVDNDGDGAIDYPMDASCKAAGDASEACTTSESIGVITAPTTTGDTTTTVDDYDPTCNAVNGLAPDLLYRLDVPALASLTLTVTGFDAVTTLLDSSCGGAPIVCSDLETVVVTNLAAGTYYVGIEGYATVFGPFTLRTQGVIAPGASCEGALFAAGTLTCPAGLTCQGAPGAKRCQSQCSDGLDNNGDGRIDFPDDPSCTSLADTTEVTVCPGAACPACGDGIDNDGDGATDYPADLGCASASGTTEAFCSIEPDVRGAIAAPVTTGTLAAPATANYPQSCQSDTGNDVVYALVLPVPVRSLVVDTLGSAVDTVLSVKDSVCGAQLGCNDDVVPGAGASQLTLTNLLPGNYAIQVDSYNSNGANNGPFTLSVRGTVSLGTACTSPLFASGVLACQPGASCTGGICR